MLWLHLRVTSTEDLAGQDGSVEAEGDGDPIEPPTGPFIGRISMGTYFPPDADPAPNLIRPYVERRHYRPQHLAPGEPE